MLTMESANRKDIRTARSARLEHRHFCFIADVIACYPTTTKDRAAIAQQFADACESSNPRFDRQRFLKACGVFT